MQIHPGKASAAALCGLDQVIEDAVGKVADVCCLHQVKRIDHHALELGQHDQEVLHGFAAAKPRDVVRNGLDAQHPGPLVLELEGERADVHIEDRQVIGGAVQNAGHAQRPFTLTLMGAALVAEEGTRLGHIKVAAGTIDESLKHG